MCKDFFPVKRYSGAPSGISGFRRAVCWRKRVPGILCSAPAFRARLKKPALFHVQLMRMPVSMFWIKKRTDLPGTEQLCGQRRGGDEYQHVSPLLDEHVMARLTGVSVIHNSPLSQKLKITAELNIPDRAERGFLKRSGAYRVCRIVTSSL